MKTKKRTNFSYPFVQSTPFGKVKIYRNQGSDRTRYVVTWIGEEGRQRKLFSEEAEAHQRAEEILDDLKQGVSFRNNITATKAVRIAEWEKTLEAHNATLADAVKYYLLHLDQVRVKKIDALDAAHTYLERFEDQAGRNYQTAKHILLRFGRHFDRTLCSITVTELDRYLKEMSKSGRTRNNHLGYLKAFFKWAQEWGNHLPAGPTAISKIKPYDEGTLKIQVFTPEELGKMLKVAPKEIIPFLTIGAFAGVRCAEIGRLTWDNIDFETKTIKLAASETKTKRRRLALMPDNLIQWLEKYGGSKEGPVLPNQFRLQGLRAEMCKTAGIAWRENALRKSYISYRMAQPDADAIQVSKQCGNSPEMVEEHYKELVSPKLAEKWFSITPTETQ